MGENNSTILKALSLIDNLNLLFIYLDSDFQPQFVSRNAAKCLAFKSRHQLGQYIPTLDPFIQLAVKWRIAQKRKGFGPLEEHKASVVSQLEVQTAENSRLSVIAYAVAMAEESAPGEAGPDGYCIVFHNTVHFSEISAMLLHATMCRHLYVDSEVTLREHKRLAEQKSSEQAPLPGRNLAFVGNWSTDVISAVNEAVDILDSCLPPTISLNVRIASTALLDIEESTLVRAVALVLLEAANYVGLAGKVALQCDLIATGDNDEILPPGRPINTARIKIVGLQAAGMPIEGNPLDLYLYHHFLPGRTQVSVTAKEDEIEDADTPILAEVFKLLNTNGSFKVSPPIKSKREFLLLLPLAESPQR